MFATLKKRRQGIYRAVPVPAVRLDQLDLVHGLREAQRRGKGPTAPCGRGAGMTAWRQVKAVIAAAGNPGWAAPHPQGPAAGDYVRQNGLRPSCQASAELRPMSLSA